MILSSGLLKFRNKLGGKPISHYNIYTDSGVLRRQTSGSGIVGKISAKVDSCVGDEMEMSVRLLNGTTHACIKRGERPRLRSPALDSRLQRLLRLH
jgi:hypothetical protein